MIVSACGQLSGRDSAHCSTLGPHQLLERRVVPERLEIHVAVHSHADSGALRDCLPQERQSAILVAFVLLLLQGIAEIVRRVGRIRGRIEFERRAEDAEGPTLREKL